MMNLPLPSLFSLILIFFFCFDTNSQSLIVLNPNIYQEPIFDRTKPVSMVNRPVLNKVCQVTLRAGCQSIATRL